MSILCLKLSLRTLPDLLLKKGRERISMAKKSFAMQISDSVAKLALGNFAIAVLIYPGDE